MSRARAIEIWAVVGVAMAAPVAIAATSPLLAWREPVYIVAGFAGVVAMSLLLLQPLLVGGYLPGLSPRFERRLHGWVGAALLAAVVIHVAGLWVTSPPDVVDALLFRSPTPFSVWGVVAMWAVFATALLAVFRRRLRVRPTVWRLAHTSLALVIVGGGAAHAVLIVGTMETASKVALCALVGVAALKVAIDVRAWAALTRARRRDLGSGRAIRDGGAAASARSQQETRT